MTGAVMRQHYVTSADGTKISLSITAPGRDAHAFDAAAIGEKIAEFALESARHRGKNNWATSSHVTEDGC